MIVGINGAECGPVHRDWADGLGARLLGRVEFSESGCWSWTGAIDKKGYGRIRINKCVLKAHRVAYEEWEGPIPPGLTLDHLCRNHACINPHHLEPVTNQENVLRGDGPCARNARATHCPQGHPYDAENTYVWPATGYRACRVCKRAHRSRYYCSLGPAEREQRNKKSRESRKGGASL